MIKLINNDCLDVMKNIPDESIDLIITDPPYLINYKTNHRKNKNHDFCKTIKNDDNFSLISEYIKNCYRILKKIKLCIFFVIILTLIFLNKN